MEGRAVLQSCALSSWEAEKQRAHMIFSHFTFQVTQLTHCPPFPKIWRFPLSVPVHLYLLPLADTQNESNLCVKQDPAFLNCFFHLMEVNWWICSQTEEETKNNFEKIWLCRSFSVLDAVKPNRGLSEKPVKQFSTCFSSSSDMMCVSLDQTLQVWTLTSGWWFEFYTWKPAGSCLEPKSELCFCKSFSV